MWETQSICEIVENRFSREMEAECRPECDLPFKNKARREQREGCSWRWVSSRASERERLGCRRMRVSGEEKTLREEINLENVKELASDCALSQWGNNVLVITVVGGLPTGHAHKQTC